MRHTKPTNPFYRTKAWKRVRLEVLARDHHLCQRCRSNRILTKADTVHHRKSLELHPELALEPSNLVSLCACCHNVVHHNKASDEPERVLRARVIKG